MKKQTRGSLILFAAACIWGMAFVAQSKGMDYMHPLTFNGVRSLIGALALLCYIVVSGGLTREKRKKTDWKSTLQAGLFCGLALTLASTLQQVGLQYTTVGKAGFITTLYIIFVPMMGIFFRKKIAPVVWGAAGIAAVGMYLLCMSEGESFVLGKGDLMMLGCAVTFAVHILVVDHYAEKADGAILSFFQFLICGLICTGGAFIVDAPTWGQLVEGALPLLYAGALSCGVGYTLQIVGQRDVNPTVAALLMSMESVVATVSGWAAYKMGLLHTDQSMTARQVMGCVLVFGAVILVQLPREWFEVSRSK